MFVVAARFTAKTWEDQVGYRERKGLVGCVYAAPLPMARSIPYRAPVFVLEMNLALHRIMGIGLVSNDPLFDVHNIHEERQFNICSYSGKYRVDREDMSPEEEELMQLFDDALFWKCKLWRKRYGLTQIPQWVKDIPDTNYQKCLRNMFVKRFRCQTETQDAKEKPKIVLKRKKLALTHRPADY